LIRYYDYAAAFIVADLMMTAFFTIPIIGAIIAYVLYDIGWKAYCEFRLRQENE
jgi:hypothetical protein